MNNIKRLIIILLFVSISGCAWFQPKAPQVRFGEDYIKSELSEYDLAMHIKKFLYAKIMIGDLAREHINNIGGKFFGEYNDSVDADKIDNTPNAPATTVVASASVTLMPSAARNMTIPWAAFTHAA